METSNCTEKCLTIDYFGRFGNQIMQFYHAVQVAYASGIRKVMIFPGFLHQNHSFMYDDIFFQINSGKDKCFHHFFFFNNRKLKRLKEIDLNSKPWKKFQTIFLEKYKAQVENDALVVHIRSGDIFDANCEYHQYGQPPCNYYLEAISMGNWSKVIVIAEDRKNPCVNIVANKTGNFKMRSFDEDISFILNAKNLVTSSGTLGYAIILLSSSIKNIFGFDLPKNVKKRCIKCAYINTMSCYPSEKYKKVVLKKWVNSLAQRKMMIESSCVNWSNLTQLK